MTMIKFLCELSYEEAYNIQLDMLILGHMGYYDYINHSDTILPIEQNRDSNLSIVLFRTMLRTIVYRNIVNTEA